MTAEVPPMFARLEGEELERYGQRVGRILMSAVAFYQEKSPRTQQSIKRIMGPSDLGGCREFIRASIAGEQKAPLERVKWNAFVGSAVGDLLEHAWKQVLPGTETQVRVKVTLPESGIEVEGSLDALLFGSIVLDVKTKDGTQDVRREGGDFGNQVQLAVYLLALLERGAIAEDAVGMLFYVDRSGKDPEPYVVTIDMRQARALLRAADDRLREVAKALASGYARGSMRDKPESWCYHVQCPFYAACWEGYMPPKEEQLNHPEILAVVRRYIDNRDIKKDAEKAMTVAGDELKRLMVTGNTKTHAVQVLTRRTKNGVSEYIDIRELPQGIPATALFEGKSAVAEKVEAAFYNHDEDIPDAPHWADNSDGEEGMGDH